jgi:formylglycine-generating enzyme required for sulfatase activity
MAEPRYFEIDVKVKKIFAWFFIAAGLFIAGAYLRYWHVAPQPRAFFQVLFGLGHISIGLRYWYKPTATITPYGIVKYSLLGTPWHTNKCSLEQLELNDSGIWIGRDLVISSFWTNLDVQRARQIIHAAYQGEKPPPPEPDLFARIGRRNLLLGGLAAVGLVGSVTLSLEHLAWLKKVAPMGLERSAVPRLEPAPFGQLAKFEFTAVTLNDQGQVAKRQQHSARYFTEQLPANLLLEMVEIPAGEFLMGTAPTDAYVFEIETQQPQHQVKLSRFFMGRFAITQAQWQAVMGNNPSHFKGENRPVEQVSWLDAQKFCKRLSQISGRTYRLSSEAEWEYACRAFTETDFHVGTTLSANLVNYDAYSYGANPEGLHREKTTPVGLFPANAFGLHDMHGNVTEWCEDFWHSNYTTAPSDGSPWLDNPNPQVDNNRICRGGSFGSGDQFCRSAYRYPDYPDSAPYDRGLRVVYRPTTPG